MRIRVYGEGSGPFKKFLDPYTARKAIKCSDETEILHELVHDTTRESESHELICVVS